MFYSLIINLVLINISSKKYTLIYTVLLSLFKWLSIIVINSEDDITCRLAVALEASL